MSPSIRDPKSSKPAASKPLAGKTLQQRVEALVEDKRFSQAIMVVIIVNAITLGLETSNAVMNVAGFALHIIDKVALAIFTLEIVLKLFAYRRKFIRDPWNVFDFIIVAIALTPSSGALSVLRALRILRALRLISIVPQMRFVVGALLSAVPGMGAIAAVLGLVFYVAAVMATKLFGEAHPVWFGSIGESMYSLFQIMTLESWSMGIVRPVMETHPLAWIYFVPFIIVTSFAVLNLFIALIVNSLQTIHDAEAQQEEAQKAKDAAEAEKSIADELRLLRQEVAELKADVNARMP